MLVWKNIGERRRRGFSRGITLNIIKIDFVKHPKFVIITTIESNAKYEKI